MKIGPDGAASWDPLGPEGNEAFVTPQADPGAPSLVPASAPTSEAPRVTESFQATLTSLREGGSREGASRRELLRRIVDPAPTLAEPSAEVSAAVERTAAELDQITASLSGEAVRAIFAHGDVMLSLYSIRTALLTGAEASHVASMAWSFLVAVGSSVRNPEAQRSEPQAREQHESNAWNEACVRTHLVGPEHCYRLSRPPDVPPPTAPENALFPELKELERPPARLATAPVFLQSASEAEQVWAACPSELMHHTFCSLPRSHPFRRDLEQRVRRTVARDPFQGIVDKVSQRRMAAEIAIFKQPRWQDIRDVSDSSAQYKTPWLTHIRHVDFSRFPHAEILRSLDGAQERPRRYVFENPDDGFVLYIERGHLTIASGNPVLAPAVTIAVSAAANPVERLNRFLEAASRALSVTKLSVARFPSDSESGEASLLAALRARSGTYYLKGARTHSGSRVMCVACAPGEDPRFETDSTDVAKYMEGLSGLSSLLYNMGPPIIEERMDTERVDGRVVEPRMICQRERMSGELRLTDFYAKVSSNRFAANRALGGEGAEVLASLERIYRVRLPTADAAALARRSLDWLVPATESFARQYDERCRLEDPRWKLPELAVDLCPVWNPGREELDFYLLEVQREFAFEGLEKLDWRRAEQIANRREALVRELHGLPVKGDWLAQN